MELGLEATPELYVARMVAIFAEVRRVLKPEGCCFLNLGDSYAAARSYQVTDTKHRDVGNTQGSEIPPGLKPKDLCGVPWRVAFALQADGWWLRNDIAWCKVNAMPESCRDRFSSKHEHVFLLTRSSRYWFDLDAVREPHGKTDDIRDNTPYDREETDKKKYGDLYPAQSLNPNAANPLGKNPGDVWRIPTRPFSGAHFATFPPALVERCLLAGCPPRICSICGVAWEHRVERSAPPRTAEMGAYSNKERLDAIPDHGHDNIPDGHKVAKWREDNPPKDLGYHPACDCDAETTPGLVLDPFAGSGTTAAVSRQHGRRSLGIELNPEYEAVMRERLGVPEGALIADVDFEPSARGDQGA